VPTLGKNVMGKYHIVEVKERKLTELVKSYTDTYLSVMMYDIRLKLSILKRMTRYLSMLMLTEIFAVQELNLWGLILPRNTIQRVAFRCLKNSAITSLIIGI